MRQDLDLLMPRPEQRENSSRRRRAGEMESREEVVMAMSSA
jgi:hypothetical protein